MFSFLYLFGPGVVCFLVRMYFYRNRKEDGGHLSGWICEILAYSAVIMALTAAILEPSGGVSIEALQNGMLTVRYGTRALALSLALAACFGVLGAIGIERMAQYRRKIVVAAVAVSAALCILVYGAGAPAPAGEIRISTKPVRINSVYYNSNVPVYMNEDQEYFIQARTLAEYLGISYEEKRTGLFRTEYCLGDDKLVVNLSEIDGKAYFKKDGELFISLSTLAGIGGAHVINIPYLADGSLREVIYIDNYARRFRYDWLQYPYIAHAMGGIDGNTYTNSREAFIRNYRAGHRVFEADLRLTRDGGLVAAHDLPVNEDGKPMLEKEFRKYKVQDRYTSLTFKDIAKLMKKYPDMYLVTDTKEKDAALVVQQFAYIVDVANEIDPEILTRIIPQIYNMEMLDTVMGVYNWNSMIYTLYALDDFSEKEVADFAYQQGIGVVATYADRAQELFMHELYDRDIKVCIYTYNTPSEEAEWRQKGAAGLYTDFLVP